MAENDPLMENVMETNNILRLANIKLELAQIQERREERRKQAQERRDLLIADALSVLRNPDSPIAAVAGAKKILGVEETETLMNAMTEWLGCMALLDYTYNFCLNVVI